MLASVWPFLIYWMVLFATCLSVVEIGHDWLYDEVPKDAPLRVAAGTAVLAALATVARPSFDTMFTDYIHWTVLQGIVWFAVFALVFQFHPWHALAAGLAVMVLVPGLATMGVQSLTRPSTAAAPAPTRPVAPPIRKSLTPVAPPAGPAAPRKAG
jgi:magnesium-transporting ATPase (P-type)